MAHFNDSHLPKVPSDYKTANEMAGTWTDPNGPKDNQISFVWTKIEDKPGDPIALISSVMETKGKIKDLFGFKDTPFTFGFRSFAPDVQPFINIDGNQMVLELKAIDHNHLRVKVLSRDFEKQKEDLATDRLSEPATILVRSKEPDYKPSYK
jgi:hypothetical protein